MPVLQMEQDYRVKNKHNIFIKEHRYAKYYAVVLKEITGPGYWYPRGSIWAFDKLRVEHIEFVDGIKSSHNSTSRFSDWWKYYLRDRDG